MEQPPPGQEPVTAASPFSSYRGVERFIYEPTVEGIQRTAERMRGTAAEQEKLIMNDIELGQQIARQKYGELKEAERIAEWERVRTRQRQAEDQKELERAQQIYRDSLETSKYTIPPERVKALQKVMEQGTPDERELARRQLDRAQQIDPNRILGDSLAKKIASAIAVGLGQYASVIGGGPNIAMQIIEKAKDDDMQSQREMLASGRQRVAEARTALGDLRDRMNNDDAADAARVSQIYEAAIRKVELAIAGTEDQQIKNQGMQLINDLKMRLDQSLLGMGNAMMQDATQKRAQFAFSGMQPDDKLRAFEIPDFEYHGSKEMSPEAANYARKEKARAEDIIDTLSEMKRKAETKGRGFGPSDWNREGKRLMLLAESKGVPKGVLASPSSWSQTNFLNAVNTVMSDTVGTLNKLMKNYNYTPKEGTMWSRGLVKESKKKAVTRQES